MHIQRFTMKEREKAQGVRLSVYSNPFLNQAVEVAAQRQMMSESAWVRGAVLARLKHEGVE